VQITGYPGDSALFQLSNYANTSVTVTVGQNGTGAATGLFVLTLKVGDVLRLVPVTGFISAGVQVSFASIYIRKLS
jgi:hypothetical protein